MRACRFSILMAVALLCSCHPLEPSNDNPDQPQLDLNKGDPKPGDDGSIGKKPNQKKDEDGPVDSFIAENEQTGTYRGYAAISSALASRLVEPGTSFDLAFYLDGAGSTDFVFRGELYKLLGSYQSDGLRSDFQNGLPNGINLLVWHLTFSGLGDELGLQCILPPVAPDPQATHPPLVLKSEAKASIKTVCGLAVLTGEQRSLALDGLWRTLTGWELPEAERVAWLEWSKSPELTSLSPSEMVAALTEAALFNPHYLLRK